MTKPIHETLEHLLASADALPGWERAFVKSAANCDALSENQERVIKSVADRLATSAIRGATDALE